LIAIPEFEGLKRHSQPDPDALIANILRKAAPKRVHHVELFHDPEIRDAIAERFDLPAGVGRDGPNHDRLKAPPDAGKPKAHD